MTYRIEQSKHGPIVIVDLTKGFTMKCLPETYARFLVEYNLTPLYCGKGYYAYFTYKRKHYSFHRWVLSCTDPKQIVSHIDSDRRNNCDWNLEIVTMSQNMCNLNDGLLSNNTSGFRGVYWNAHCSAWCAQIKIKRETIPLGSFDTFSAACKARVNAEERCGFYSKGSKIDV
jgi:hypothetical protein